MLPYAALWHLIFAAWAFSWFKLWPDPSSVVAKGSFGDFVRAIGVQSSMHRANDVRLHHPRSLCWVPSGGKAVLQQPASL